MVAEEHAPSGDVARAAYDGDGHVLLERTDGTARRLELYNLQTDPAEERPLPLHQPAGERLAAELASLVAALPRAPRGPVPTPDRALEERLRALGYVH